MNTVKDEDDFWYSSERRSFCFENEVMVDQLKSDTQKLWTGIFSTSNFENSLQSTNDLQTTKSLLSVISEKTLSRNADNKSKNDHPKTERKYHEIDDTQPDITLRHILLGQSYSLERYKSLARKTALLDAAISNGDGNSILIIILFLIKTLKRSLVQRLLMERPDAINVYIYYLFIRLQTSEITDILTMLGHSSTAAMKNLHIVIKNTKDPNRLQQKLHNCYKALFTMLPNCKETIFLESYIKLLEWQMAIKQKKNDEELLLNSSILESLHYACKHHCNTPNDFVTISPMMLSRNHNISPRLYEKVTLQVKAACGGWDDIDRLLLTKGILGNTKLQTHLYTEDVLKILYKYNAPHTVLEKYLKFIDNLEKRLELAKKLSCHTIVIDIFVQQGDRAVLMDYKAKLQPQSEDYFYAESALHLPNIKWKN
ncbi:PREDICTED: spermatogenesis-defective protein 39 homolog isoform X2 [Cyphomyrmex costatus]|uniref:spermatogenesis-defective protein 39 homolog isoform X2 n=1 Tax=Cyphomyrmex costatus TaxID=456900 RepID=UPI00085227CF|nr:PREDICTED: spermatogenesis-defective protein 39 homolog isoform X2 [Cyphomyrmex costatus]